MTPEVTALIESDRLYISESHPRGPFSTRSFPIKTGADGRGYALFADEGEAEVYAGLLSPDDPLDLHQFGEPGPTAIALADMPLATRRRIDPLDRLNDAPPCLRCGTRGPQRLGSGERFTCRCCLLEYASEAEAA